MRNRMLFEMNLGYSHQCNGCGKIFLQHEDGCPDCGVNASVSLIQQCPGAYKELDPDDKDWYIMFFDEISQRIIILSKESVKEIRLQDKDEIFLYWIVIVAGEPQYVFLSDACLWPK